MIDVVSGGLTVLTILLGIAVLKHWGTAAKKAVVSERKLTSEQWLILGVVIAFVGQTLDNMYWLVTWTAHYFDATSELTTTLFDNGMLANIPFRQACGIVAAYCHVHAAVMVDKAKTVRFRLFMLVAASAGLAFSLAMVFLKG